MLWCRIKNVFASVCLTSFFVVGQAQAYEIPDGVDPATVLVGHLIRDDYRTATRFLDFEEQYVYASQLDVNGIFTIPDGYVFIDSSAVAYGAAALGRELVTRLETWSDDQEAAAMEVVVRITEEFAVGPGPFDASNTTYLDMTPIYDAAVAGAPSVNPFFIGMFIPTGPKLLSEDTFNVYVDFVIQTGGDLYGLQPDDPGLLSILASLPDFDGAGANTGPTADAGADQTVASGAAVTLDGTGSSDPDTGDTLSYAWTQTSGTTVSLTGATTATPGFTAPEIGANDPAAELVFSLVVTDDKGNAATADTVTIMVEAPANTGPTADAGADRTVPHYGGLVTLDGSGSSDPDAGDTLSYLWTQTSGTVVKVIGAGTITPKFSAPVLGANDPAVELVFSLVVTDDKGNASTADTVTITVEPPANTGPTADAGADQTVASGASVTLDGTGSSDPDTGDTLSYAWTQTSGTTVSLTGATTAAPSFTAPEIRPYDAVAAIVFSLVVTDDKGNVSDADTVTITVSPTGPTPASEFGRYEAEIRNTITGLGLAGINSTIASNERMMRDARERLLRSRAGQGGDVPFRIDPNLTQNGTTLSSSGTFYGQWAGENGQRLVSGDFVLRHDERTGATTATLTGRAAWERMVSDRTLLGAFLGGEFAQSDLIAPRDGTHRRFGLTVGGYGVHELRDGLFADGFVTLGAGRNNLEMSTGELDLDGDYTTRTLTFGGALSGVIDRGAYQVLPELALSYGRVQFGEAGFTGHAFGLTDDSLRMQVGDVSLAKITLTPEIRFTADGTPVAQSRSVFSLAPRLTCQEFRTNIAVEDCGGGLEIGFTGRSEDGLSTFTARAGADRISGRTATTLQLGVNVRF